MRAYSPKKVVEMIQYLHERWGVRHIMFVDDLFLASRLRVTEFCERLLARPLDHLDVHRARGHGEARTCWR